MADGQDETFIFICLGGSRFAIPTIRVREVVQLVEPTPMPSWPEDVLGVVNVRGELIPLVDISATLGLLPVQLSKDQCIVLINALGRDWGVLVDRVDDVRAASVKTGSEMFEPGIVAVPAVCLGVITDAAGTVIVLDLERVIRPIPALGAPKAGKI